MDILAFSAFLQVRREVQMATSMSGVLIGDRWG